MCVDGVWCEECGLVYGVRSVMWVDVMWCEECDVSGGMWCEECDVGGGVFEWVLGM